MCPNPQDALPLPARPTVAEFTMMAEALAGRSTCALADAQTEIARTHGFLTWAELLEHIQALADPSSEASAFEDAADALVTGDEATLAQLLRQHPRLVRARSMREHRATLLHYVSANGVENYRQRSPKNIARMAELLFEHGAEVDAEADVYGGRCTTLGLVATSAPPQIAGVQRQLIDLLLDHGARVDTPGNAGRRDPLVRACLANGQPDAAVYLGSRGAPIDLASAAGLGRIDLLQRFVNDDGSLNEGAIQGEMKDGFSLACAYGRLDAVDFLLDRGFDVNTELRGYGEGHTGLHVASFHAHVAVVKSLLRRGASVTAIDKTWGTRPLDWALTGWTRASTSGRDGYYTVVELLVGAGAEVTRERLESEKVGADPRMRAALTRSRPEPQP